MWHQCEETSQYGVLSNLLLDYTYFIPSSDSGRSEIRIPALLIKALVDLA